jgi:tetratricopeptide (TPR) repeat protein
MKNVFALAVFAILASQAIASSADSSAALRRADAAWERRGDGRVAARARPEPIEEAIELYRAALVAEPDRLDAHWKFQRALWFAGDFATSDRAAERARYEDAIAAADVALDVLASRVGGRAVLDQASAEALREALATTDRDAAAHFYFWRAVNLGAWAREAGLLQAVRAGAADRIYDATLRSIALDPDVEQGGALRLLSRLHAELPRVPFLSGWVDHEQAIPLAERVVSEYPAHPGNPFLLGLTLLERAPLRRAEALALLERTAALEPRPDHVVEDISIQIAAREELEKARRAARSAIPSQALSDRGERGHFAAASE